MAQPSVLYRFHINHSDIEQGIYKTFDLRLAMHPSESQAYLLTRLIAYILNDREFLEFAPEGLGDPDAPALQATTPNGEILLWIEIGNPSAKKLHKAAKAARSVKVYTYKDPETLLKDIRSNKVFHAEAIEIYSLNVKTLESLAGRLERKNSWDFLFHEGALNISIGEFVEITEIVKHQV